jgi:hypothetical protein
MTYRLWWTVGYVCTTEREFLATKHRLLPATYETMDDALRRANQVNQADKSRLEREAIRKIITKRGSELAVETVQPWNARAARER